MAAQAQLHADWLRYEGPKFGAEKAECLALASVFMNPGLVGLGILDAFSAGLPMLTTDLPLHSPEIEYLAPGVNGLMSRPDAQAYASDILALLRDPARLAALAAGARASGEHYSIETMVRNFSAGVLACLGR
jgi:glycosyltransferase involved in cell wall biosynthesis